MLSLFTRYRHITLLVACVFCSLTLLSLNRPAETILTSSNVMERTMLFLLQPFQSTVSGVISKIQQIWSGYIALVNLHEENQRLQQQLQLVNAEKNLYVEKSLAYDRLKDTLHLMEERQFSTILARVIGYDASNQANTIIVNRGANDGVQESWPVITPDGIAGLTVSVSPTSSKVLLLTDPSCNVAALIQRTRDQGIVGGQSKKNAYLMKYVNKRATIREGVTYQITETALQELGKAGIPGFRIADHVLPRLQEAGIPTDTLLVLEELKDLLYVSQTSFVHALEAIIGKEQTDWYLPIFLQFARADLLVKLQQLKDQPYPSEKEFLNALTALIGPEQMRQYQDIIVNQVREEETVVSSGLGGIFPKGLKIGTVSKVLKEDYDLFQDIEVTPSVDFSKLEEVLIIRRTKEETVESGS